MSSKGDTYENQLLACIFQNANIPLVGDATGIRGSTVVGNLYLSLHTADPGEAGTQTTNEISYTGYARVAVVRSAGGFTVTGNSVSPTANVDFPVCTAGSGTATHFAIGTDVSGTGKILYYGPITPSIAVSVSVIPRITTASTVTES